MTKWEQILQLLGGLRAYYNSIVASLKTHKDNVSLYLVHNILLTYEQRFSFHNSIAKDDVIFTNFVYAQHLNFNNKRTIISIILSIIRVGEIILGEISPLAKFKEITTTTMNDQSANSMESLVIEPSIVTIGSI